MAFCDSEGRLYIATGLEPPVEWWRNTFRFIPGIFRQKVNYEITPNSLDINELRELLMNRVLNLEPNPELYNWIKALESAESIEDLISL